MGAVGPVRSAPYPCGSRMPGARSAPSRELASSVALSLCPSNFREREGLGCGQKGGEGWVEEALTSCPGHDLSLPPPTPSCQPLLRSFEAGDSCLVAKGGGGPLSTSPAATCLQMAL